MNKIVICLFLFLTTSLPVFAETTQTPAESPAANIPSQNEGDKHHGIKLKQLSEELGLSKDQESKIKSLFKKNKQKIKEIRKEGKAEIKETLTPEKKLK